MKNLRCLSCLTTEGYTISDNIFPKMILTEDHFSSLSLLENKLEPRYNSAAKNVLTLAEIPIVSQ